MYSNIFEALVSCPLTARKSKRWMYFKAMLVVCYFLSLIPIFHCKLIFKPSRYWVFKDSNLDAYTMYMGCAIKIIISIKLITIAGKVNWLTSCKVSVHTCFAVHFHNDFLLAILAKCQALGSTPGGLMILMVTNAIIIMMMIIMIMIMMIVIVIVIIINIFIHYKIEITYLLLHIWNHK